MAQFPLLMNGAEVCTLEDLKRNFDPNALIEYRKRFAAWLKGWDYDEEAVEVKTLDQDLTDEQWLNLVCNIVGITEQEIVTSKKKADKVKALELEKLKLKQIEEQQRSIAKEKKRLEKKRLRELVPTPENIHIEINYKKSPFRDAISMVYVSEKGMIIKTISGNFYFGNDCENFIFVTPRKNPGYWTSLGREDLFFCERDFEIIDATEHYPLKQGHSVDWNGIIFFVKDTMILQAWKSGYKKLSVAEKCNFPIKGFACFRDNLILWSESNEFAIGEIQVR